MDKRTESIVFLILLILALSFNAGIGIGVISWIITVYWTRIEIRSERKENRTVEFISSLNSSLVDLYKSINIVLQHNIRYYNIYEFTEVELMAKVSELETSIRNVVLSYGNNMFTDTNFKERIKNDVQEILKSSEIIVGLINNNIKKDSVIKSDIFESKDASLIPGSENYLRFSLELDICSPLDDPYPIDVELVNIENASAKLSDAISAHVGLLSGPPSFKSIFHI